MYVFLFLLILMYILFYCSFFTNIVGSLTMIVYLMFIHLIFCLFSCFCVFKFSFLFIRFVLYFPHMCLWFVFSVSRIYKLILSIAVVYTNN